MKEYLGEAEDMGRKGDTYLAHMTGGELVIPKAFANDPELRALVDAKFKSHGVSTEQFIVGTEKNSINPETGQPEFGFKIGGIDVTGTIAGAAIGYFMPGGGVAAALTGAKAGATFDIARASINNAQAAREQAAQAQAQALEAARVAREQAAQQSQAALAQAAADAAAARQIQIDALNAQKADSASRLQQLQLSSQQQAQLMQNLTAQQQQAANAAMLQLNEQQKQYQEQKLTMEKAAADQAAALQEERRKVAERESAQMTARRRSGRRSLLSEARLTPEVGVMGQEEAPKVLLGA